MQTPRLAIASEEILNEYRNNLKELLSAELNIQIFDMNIMTNWETKEDLVTNCVEKILNHSIDFVVLVSRSGNGLQMLANKNDQIRAAPIPRTEYIEEAATLEPNMCEVDATFHNPESACNLVIELFRALEFIV